MNGTIFVVFAVIFFVFYIKKMDAMATFIARYFPALDLFAVNIGV